MFQVHVFDTERKFLSMSIFASLREAHVFIKNLPDTCPYLLTYKI